MCKMLWIGSLAALSLPAWGAEFARTANITGSRGDRGKCTIEVVVDGAADVEIRGDRGIIRTLSGQRASWRRMECSEPLPNNPVDFRFSGIDGRGRQTLVRDPGNNRGVAVVRIEDPKGGSEGYTFDLEWRGGYGGGNGGGYPGGGGGRPPYPGGGGGGGGWGSFPGGARQAIRVCEDEARRQILDRGFNDVNLYDSRVDDGPGRNDWVVGNARARGRGRDRSFRFSCQVNLQNGKVRSVRVD